MLAKVQTVRPQHKERKPLNKREGHCKSSMWSVGAQHKLSFLQKTAPCRDMQNLGKGLRAVASMVWGPALDN